MNNNSGIGMQGAKRRVVICLSGPSRCGKDTSGQFIKEIVQEEGLSCATVKFVAPAVRAVKAFLNFPDDVFDRLREQGKDIKMPGAFGAVSLREALIAMSEQHAKALYGSDIFGRMAAIQTQKLLQQGADVVVVTDCGFQEEFEIYRALLMEDRSVAVHLACLFREGTTYIGDSRSRVSSAYNSFLLPNHGDKGSLRRACLVYTLGLLKGMT